jgi:hypothetical protein
MNGTTVAIQPNQAAACYLKQAAACYLVNESQQLRPTVSLKLENLMQTVNIKA